MVVPLRSASSSVCEAMVASSVASVVVANERGEILEFSAGAEKLFGHAREVVIGQTVEMLMAPEERDDHRRAIERSRQSANPRRVQDPAPATGRRLLALHADGHVFPIELSLHAISIGEARGWLATQSAIAPELHASDRSEQLLAAQRLELLGTLASGVAHDLNNLLTPILAAADLLSQADLSPEHVADLDAVRHAGEQGRHLVRQLLYFARKHATEAVPVSTPDVAQQVASILRRTLPPRVSLEIAASSPLPSALVDAVQLEQVLLNLTGNAIHAVTGAGGLVRVALDQGAPDEASTASSASAPSGDFVRIRVMDSGPGVADELAKRIFEPFFTTKPAGVGTGLGLSVCQGIAERHGGSLRLESGDLPGACFALYLPVAGPAAHPQPASTHPPASLNLRRVLAVDDDAATLRALTRLLGRLDVEVHGFTEPLEALAYFENDPQSFDIVLTDGMMPTMSGLEFARAVRAKRADVPVLLVSGLGETLAGVEQVDAVLAKPFRLVDLREALAAAVANRAGGLSA